MSVQITCLVKNSIWMILYRFTAQGLAVIFTILLARRLGNADFGAYAFIAAIIFVANALTTFGTDMLLIREIAAKNDLSALPFALILQLALCLVFISLVWLFGDWIPNQVNETITALKIYSLALIPLAFFTVFTTALRGVQLMSLYALLNIILPLLQISAVLFLREKNLILLSSFLLSAQIVMALIAGLLCSFFISQFWRSWHFSSIRGSQGIAFHFLPVIKATTPMAWLTLLGMTCQRLNIYLLSTMSGATETGIYSAAFRVVEASKTTHIAVFAALYPAMAQDTSFQAAASLDASETLQRTARQAYTSSTRPAAAMTYLTAGAILISLMLFTLAKPLVTVLYGTEFSASSNVLQILAWILIPFTINTYLTLSFLASHQESIVGRALTASLLGLLILNLWWIPLQGPEGSAWAMLIAECIQSIILLAGARTIARVKGTVHELSELS